MERSKVLTAKVLIAIIVILVIAIIGLVAYILFTNNKDNSSKNDTLNEGSTVNIASVGNNTTVNNDNSNNNVVLYNGTEISTNPGIHQYGNSLNANDSATKQKYDNKKYYNYEDSRYVCESIGKLEGSLGNPDSEDFFGNVTNTSRIATLNKLTNPFPREIEKIENIVIVEQLKQYNLIYKCDFDGDGKIEYLCFKYSDIMPVEKNEVSDNLANLYTEKYITTVDLIDENYNLISHLVTFSDYRWDNNISDPIYLKNIDIIDIDNDGIMEIFIDLYLYEESGNVAIYKYMNNQIYGETNYTANILP